MADVNAILAAFRQELILAELVRRPSEAAPAGAPPMFLEPVEGPPAPGEREGIEDDPGLILSLMHSGDIAPSSNYDARAGIVRVLDVRYRSKTSSDLRRAAALDQAIADRLIRPETNLGYGFLLAAGTPAQLWVQSAGIFGGFGPVGRSKATGYDHLAKYAVVAGA